MSSSQILGSSKYMIAKSEVLNMIGRLHDELRSKHSITGKVAFDDIIKILFIRFIQPHLKGRLNSLMDPSKYTKLTWFQPKYLQVLDFEFLLKTTDSDFETLFHNCWDLLCEHEFTSQIYIRGKSVNCSISTVRFCMNEIYKVLKDTEFDMFDSDIKGVIYEEFINNYGSVGKEMGQFFTSRQLIHVIFKMLEVECIGLNQYENVYDPAAGTFGFIMEAIKKYNITPQNANGHEIAPATYATGLMNILLTTGEPGNSKCIDSLRDISNNKFKLIVTNPPFGTKNNKASIIIEDCKKKQTQNDMNTSYIYQNETNDLCMLFLQHCMAKLDDNGTCAIVLPHGKQLTWLNEYLEVRKRLIEQFDIRAILIVGGGSFQSTDVSTVVVIFQKNGQSTQNLRYFEYDGQNSYKYLDTIPINRVIEKNYSFKYSSYVRLSFMSDILPNFQIKKLADICKHLPNTNKHLAGEGKSSGLYQFYSCSEDVMFIDTVDYTELCILINGGGNANVRIASNFSRSGDVKVIKADNDITTYYIYYYLRTNISNLQELMTGATIKHMTQESINQIDVPIPSIEEQKLIVENCMKIERLKYGSIQQIELLKQAIQATKAGYFRALLDEPIKTIGEICDFLPKRGDYKSGDGALSGQYRFYSCAKTTKFIDTCEYNEPCLIINKGGNPNVRMDNNFTVSNDIHVIRFINPDNTTNLVLTYYVYHYLKVNIEEIGCKMSGATIKHLTKEDLKNINIKVPDQETQLKYIQAFVDYDTQIQSTEKLIDVIDGKIKETFIGLTSSA